MKFPKFKIHLIFNDGSLSEPRWVQFALASEGWISNTSKANWTIGQKTRINGIIVSSPRNDFFAPAKMAVKPMSGDTVHLLPQAMRIEWEPQNTLEELYPAAKQGLTSEL
jgi:hypothetical protein